MKSSPSIRGFTLIELLAVIGVMMLLMTAIGPSIGGAMKGLNLTTQGNAVADAVAMARQIAVTRNREIELRLVILPYSGQTTGNWGFQLWEIDASGGAPKAISSLSRFNESIIINSSISPLIGHLTKKTAVFAGGQTYSYHALRFRPNGRIVDQFGGDNYFSLSMRHEDIAEPENFYTLQVNPMTGGAQIYRP